MPHAPGAVAPHWHCLVEMGHNNSGLHACHAPSNVRQQRSSELAGTGREWVLQPQEGQLTSVKAQHRNCSPVMTSPARAETQ